MRDLEYWKAKLAANEEKLEDFDTDHKWWLSPPATRDTPKKVGSKLHYMRLLEQLTKRWRKHKDTMRQRNKILRQSAYYDLRIREMQDRFIRIGRVVDEKSDPLSE